MSTVYDLVDAEAHTDWIAERPDRHEGFDPSDFFEVTGDGVEEPDDYEFDGDAWNQGNKESELDHE